MRTLFLATILVSTALLGCIGSSPDESIAPESVAEAPNEFGFTDVYAFPNPTFPVQLGTTCAEKTDGDPYCGLDEPSIVVDARGYIYYTAACCFLVSSPVFVSQDGGATFQAMTHPLKDFYGNEGDLALDNEGNLYYMDIDLATFGIAVWNADGEPQHGYRRAGELVVDRPWIRAGADGVVHAIYNTGSDTVYYRSTDHAMTFSPLPVARLGAGLGQAYSDIRHDLVGMVQEGAFVESQDEGATWGDPTNIGGCTDADGFAPVSENAAVDEAGTVWFQRAGCIVGKRVDGSWTAESWAVPEGIEVFFSSAAAGAAGAVAVAYYGQTDGAVAGVAGTEALEADGWYVFLSYTTNADSAAPVWTTVLADADPVAFGDVGRRLGDFMSVAVGPDGSVHIAYAKNPEMDDSATAVYRGTTTIAGMAPGVALVGPFEDA